MANGKPSDHPLTDILVYNRGLYSTGADELIRKIASLSSRRELDEWWQQEIGWQAMGDDVLRKAQTYYAELLKRAKHGGWEV
ncbi:MAG TPA: hypothetical protein VGK30_17950 [Candidatus Binatia bacterium]|jgi:hypothetical protein